MSQTITRLPPPPLALPADANCDGPASSRLSVRTPFGARRRMRSGAKDAHANCSQRKRRRNKMNGGGGGGRQIDGRLVASGYTDTHSTGSGAFLSCFQFLVARRGERERERERETKKASAVCLLRRRRQQCSRRRRQDRFARAERVCLFRWRRLRRRRRRANNRRARRAAANFSRPLGSMRSLRRTRHDCCRRRQTAVASVRDCQLRRCRRQTSRSRFERRCSAPSRRKTNLQRVRVHVIVGVVALPVVGVVIGGRRAQRAAQSKAKENARGRRRDCA